MNGSVTVRLSNRQLGGAISTENSVTITDQVKNTRFEGNRALDGGSALYSQLAIVDFVDCTFYNQTSDDSGGKR